MPLKVKKKKKKGQGTEQIGKKAAVLNSISKLVQVGRKRKYKVAVKYCFISNNKHIYQRYF